jgi:nondiscriminating aspartyl-tRNA synthetase
VGPETLIEYRPLPVRDEVIGNIFRLQAALLRFLQEFLTQRRFTEIITSKLVASGTEGGTNLFEVKYFDRVAYLAQSPQFYKEHGVAGFERVFETKYAFLTRSKLFVRLGGWSNATRREPRPKSFVGARPSDT